MWLTSHRASEMLQVALNRRTPPLKARPRQVRRQLTVQPPRAPLRAGEFGSHRSPNDFEPIPQARQQPVELLVTQVDLSGEELADARLPHPAKARQLRLGSVVVSMTSRSQGSGPAFLNYSRFCYMATQVCAVWFRNSGLPTEALSGHRFAWPRQRRPLHGYRERQSAW